MAEPESDFARFAGISGAAVVGAFFLSPVLDQFPATMLFWIALSSASALIWFYKVWGAGRFLGWASIAIGGGSLLVALLLFDASITVVQADEVANDRRCLAIQRDMLSARPRRNDSPALFHSLDCRPQGEGSVYAPPRGR